MGFLEGDLGLMSMYLLGSLDILLMGLFDLILGSLDILLMGLFDLILVSF